MSGGDKSALINIILALICQSKCTKKNPNLGKLVDEVVELVKTPPVLGSASDETSLLTHLKALAIELRNIGTDTAFDNTYIIARMRILDIYFKEVVELIKKTMTDFDSVDDEQLQKEYFNCHRLVLDFIKEKKFRRIFQKYSMDLYNNVGNTVSRDVIMQQFNNEIAPFITASITDEMKLTDIAGITRIVDVDDEELLGQIYQETIDLYSNMGVFKFPLQGWNESYGDKGGWVRGTMKETQAFSGGGKSEKLRYDLTGIARCNDPVLIDPTKKPLLVYFTLEDTTREAYERIFLQLYREEHEKLVNVADLPFEEVASYVKNKMRARGWHFMIIQGEKGQLTPYDVINVMETLNQQGYELQVMSLDYMLLLNLNEMHGFLDTYKVKNSYGLVGGYCKTRAISFATAAQIDDGAKHLLEDAPEFALKAVWANLSAGSKYIIHELDIREFVHIVERNGIFYFQCAIGKNRTTKAIPREMAYSVYEMHSIMGQAGGFIKPDFNDVSRACRKTGGKPISQGGDSSSTDDFF